MRRIEECGYPVSYLVESLRCEKLNHVTSFYNLITTKFEY